MPIANDRRTWVRPHLVLLLLVLAPISTASSSLDDEITMLADEASRLRAGRSTLMPALLSFVALLLCSPPSWAQQAAPPPLPAEQPGQTSEQRESPGGIPVLPPTRVVAEAAPGGDTQQPPQSTFPEVGRLTDPVPKAGITREIFQYRNNRRLGDILEREPGVYLGGPPGENKDIRLRGMDKEFTRVQLDGVQLPGAGEKREFDANLLPSFILGEVTIIRNPTAEFESDGIAGRVDLRTRPIPTKFEMELRAGYGGTDGFRDDNFLGSIGLADRPTDWFGYLGAYDVLDLDIFRTKSRDEFRRNGTLKKSEFEDESSDQTYSTLFWDLAVFHDVDEFHFKTLRVLLFQILQNRRHHFAGNALDRTQIHQLRKDGFNFRILFGDFLLFGGGFHLPAMLRFDLWT